MGKTASVKIPNPCHGALLETRTVPDTHFGVRLPFTPSNVQLKKYCILRDYKMVTNYHNDPPTVTFDEEALGIMTKRYPRDPLFKLIGEYRELEKCGGFLKSIQAEVDGRYREPFKHTPKTLRLAMEVLQLLPNPAVHGEDSVYNLVRGLFVASPGHVLLARDFSGIEAILVAYFAGDKDLFRLCNLDVHGFLSSHAIKQPVDLSWSDADLMALFDERKARGEKFLVNGKERKYKGIRQACKRALYLGMYLGGAKQMVRSEPETFEDVKNAQWFLDLLFDTFPSIGRWHWAVCEEAESKGYVTTPSGFRQWFPEGVFSYERDTEKGKWVKKLGDVAKEVVACKPQHTAFTFSARALKLSYDDPRLCDTLRLSIHDEIMTEQPEGKVEEHDMILKEYMEMPDLNMPLPPEWGQGEYLRVRTESKFGHRWSEMH